MGCILEYPQHLTPSAWPPRHAHFSTNIGGGAYRRELSHCSGARVYRVRKLCTDGEFSTVTQALAQWRSDRREAGAPVAAVIDIADSGTYHEAPHIVLEAGEQLQIRASNMARPVLRMFDYHGGAPEQIGISGAPGSTLVLDGLLVAGGAIAIDTGASACVPDGAVQERFVVTLRHTTLVPGWEADSASRAPWRGKPSVLLGAAGVVMRVEHCVLGPIQVLHADAMVALHVADSIIDGGHRSALAITGTGYGSAPARASFVRATVIGLAQVHEIALAENSVFLGPLLVAQRHAGRVRLCYVAPGSRTPQREHCEPAAARDAERVRPRYCSLRYGMPGYGQLAHECINEINCGVVDDAGMEAFQEFVHAAGDSAALRYAML
jgi:hypothetical protein